MLNRRIFGLSLAAAAVHVGAAAARGDAQAQTTAPGHNAYAAVDPELRPVATRAIPMLSRIDASRPALPQLRERYSGAGAPGPFASPPALEHMIPGPAGGPPVKVYVVNADPARTRPAVLHFHGGGLISGAARANLRSNQNLASAHDIVVVSVDYRLAPETPYPGPVEDGYAALLWVLSNAADLGVDPRRIAVKGESAGGGLAALVALAARDRREANLCAQLLIYPMLDDRTGARGNRVRPLPYLWTPEANQIGWAAFLGSAPSGDQLSRAVPARVQDLSGLPPTFIGVGAIDLFAGENVAYAGRLIDAGVPTELLVLPGAFHAFDELAPQTQPAKVFKAAWTRAMRRAFELPPQA